ncbi:MAG TPA: M20/M25/M40 family metallo-hydrolase, partial [Thermoanaerobaculia bacterium]|nr:M20/M25/M40 family metallo-hydrolase [Thermoanaerobaculia bacterium]
DVDIRVLDDEKPEAMLDKVKALMPKEARLEVLLQGEPTVASSTQTDLYRLLVADFKKSEPGSVAGPIISAGTSDSRYFRARGIEAYGIAPFKVNYYDADTVHAADERIRARFFDEGVELMRRIVQDFCAKK